MNLVKQMKKQMLVAAATLLLSACGAGDFNYGKVKNIIEGSPVRLDAEYVMLSQGELECGTTNDIWDAPSDVGGHMIARLTQKGRDLKFGDDVSVGDMQKPYVQIRGDFPLTVLEIVNERDGPQKDSKVVETRLGIQIQHSCFPNPLPLLGVKKGAFREDINPLLQFQFNNGWYLDKIVHN